MFDAEILGCGERLKMTLTVEIALASEHAPIAGFRKPFNNEVFRHRNLPVEHFYSVITFAFTGRHRVAEFSSWQRNARRFAVRSAGSRFEIVRHGRTPMHRSSQSTALEDLNEVRVAYTPGAELLASELGMSCVSSNLQRSRHGSVHKAKLIT